MSLSPIDTPVRPFQSTFLPEVFEEGFQDSNCLTAQIVYDAVVHYVLVQDPPSAICIAQTHLVAFDVGCTRHKTNRSVEAKGFTCELEIVGQGVCEYFFN